jgi:hypothetical protein
MIVLLLFVYPMLGANQLVGTDLSQAVPLTLAAALGALAFGHVEFSVTTSIILGSVPAVLIGSFFSSRAPDRFVRPAITFVIFASGLKYIGVSTNALGWILCAVLLAAGAAWLGYARPWQNGTPALVTADGGTGAGADGGIAGSGADGSSPRAVRAPAPGPGQHLP